MIDILFDILCFSFDADDEENNSFLISN